ncbi:sensor histidine kinase [Lentzea kentuckyensis]|uniref:sensor histidine kinase n=1 Tax=Lentzea kentuckyensis TaxID=360086 RepID=UPI000A3CAA4C|nr:ATP-binding protein [Lentzea kentuckyensis]
MTSTPRSTPDSSDAMRRHTELSEGTAAWARTRGTGPPPNALPPLVDHAGYRVAQEALTNALRHSDATRMDLHLHHTPDAVVITVADNGSTTPAEPADGTGLRGLRERARLLGGTLRIEPNQPSGWVVEARLPLREGR